MPTKRCVVSFRDPDGILHSVDVFAASMYEAVIAAVQEFRAQDCEPGRAAHMTVETVSTIRHELSLQKVRSWANGPARNPQEKMRKDQALAVLDGERSRTV